MFKKYFWVSFFLCILTSAVLSENTAEIIFFSGEGFSIIRDKSTTVYSSEDEVVNLPVLEGDTIITETGTLVEVQIKSSGSVILIAESSRLILDSFFDFGGGLIYLNYGRVRAIINEGGPGTEFYILASDTIAGVTGQSDFGVDLFFDSSGNDPEKKATAYAFSGEVSVLKRNLDENMRQYRKMSSDQKTIVLANNEMTRSSSLYPEQELFAEPISSMILDFWMNTPLMAIGNTRMSQPEEFALMKESEINIQETLSMDSYTIKQKLQVSGAVTFGLGAATMTTGMILYMFVPDNRLVGQAITGFGAGLSAMGLTFLTTSMFYDDQGNLKFKKKEKE